MRANKYERDIAKKKYSQSKSQANKENWRTLNSQLNEAYASDESEYLQQQMEELKHADKKGNYTTTWKIINNISGKDKRTTPKSRKETALLLSMRKRYYRSGGSVSALY